MDASVRTAAFGALKTLASPDHAPGMVAALLKTEKGKEREAAEVAVAAVCAQLTQPEKQAEPVLAATRGLEGPRRGSAPASGSYRRSGRAESTPRTPRRHRFGAALRGPDRPLQLARTPGAANDDLLALAVQAKHPADQLAALQALIRVNTVLIDRTPEERLAALNVMKKAMPLATRDEERRAILAGLGNVRYIETLRFVVPYLDEPALAAAACKGVVELAHSKMLREPNKAEFEKALDRVITLCKDKALVDRAKQYKEGQRNRSREPDVPGTAARFVGGGSQLPVFGLTLEPTKEKEELALEPRVVMAAMHTTMIRASITAYSTAVGPSSLFMKVTADRNRQRISDLRLGSDGRRNLRAAQGQGNTQ